jgi:hypothetical protein
MSSDLSLLRSGRIGAVRPSVGLNGGVGPLAQSRNVESPRAANFVDAQQVVEQALGDLFSNVNVRENALHPWPLESSIDAAPRVLRAPSRAWRRVWPEFRAGFLAERVPSFSNTESEFLSDHGLFPARRARRLRRAAGMITLNSVVAGCRSRIREDGELTRGSIEGSCNGATGPMSVARLSGSGLTNSATKANRI